MNPSFSEAFTDDDCEVFIDDIAAGRTPHGAIASLSRHMAALAQAGILRRIDHLGGRRIDLVEEWNAHFEDRDRSWADVASRWFAPLSFLCIRHIVNAAKEGRLRELRPLVRNTIIGNVYDGNAMYLLGAPEAMDLDSGEQFRSELRRWHLVVGTEDKDGASVHLDPVVGVAPPTATSVEIDFPTGEIVACDWVWMHEFTAATEILPPADINLPEGRHKETLDQAAVNGIVHVHVGNTCPRIMVGDGVIAIGDAGPEDDRIPDGFSLQGSITTDTNWATLVDRQVLIGLLVKGGMTREHADQAVAREILKHAHLLSVRPGRHRLTFTASEHLGPLLPVDHPTVTGGFGPRLMLEQIG